MNDKFMHQINTTKQFLKNHYSHSKRRHPTGFFIFNSYILQTKTDQKYRFPSFQILKATASKLQNNEKITESSVNFFLFSTYRRESGAEMSLTYGAGAQLCQ